MRLVFSCFIALLCSSCAGVRKAELSAINKFAAATSGISKVPSGLHLTIATIKNESNSLQASTMLALRDSGIDQMTVIRDQFEDQLQANSEAMQYGRLYMVLERYGNLLQVLSSPDYLKTFVKEKEEWQKSMDSLIVTYNKTTASRQIPKSFGGLCGSIISACGQKKDQEPAAAISKIRYKKEGAGPVSDIADTYLELQGRVLARELALLTETVENNYKDFFSNVKRYEDSTGRNPFNYYHSYLPLYNTWMHQIKEAEALHQTSTKAFATLKTSMNNISTAIDKKDGFADILKSSRLLFSDYLDVKDAHKKYEEERKKMIALQRN